MLLELLYIVFTACIELIILLIRLSSICSLHLARFLYASNFQTLLEQARSWYFDPGFHDYLRMFDLPEFFPRLETNSWLPEYYIHKDVFDQLLQRVSDS